MVKLEPTNMKNTGLGGGLNFLYMNEVQFNSRSVKINKLVAALKDINRKGLDPNDYWKHYCFKFDINPSSLTSEEQDYINEEVFA